MKKFLQVLAVLALLIWGGIFLYFYTSGRIEKYLDPSFRIYALISGVGFILLGAFNFLNRNREAGVCTHDHAHGDSCEHDHHDHDHDHRHEPEHDHKHDHQNGHDHEHDHAHGCCGHDHDHEHDHKHDHSHDHDHDQDHDHDHDHEPAHSEPHSHDHEETLSGVAFSLLVLLVPLLVATAYSKDRFSSDYVAKWGKIERQMLQKRIADAQSAKTDVAASATPVTNPYTREGIEAAEGATSGSTPYPGQPDTPPEPKKDEAAAAALGAFSMEDLKKMVPQNDKGEFLLDVPQIFYTAGDKELMEVMEGIPVETTAQLMEETLNNPDKTRLKAFRLFIECCAADARPLSIPVDFGKAPPTYTEMGWYKLYGKLHYAKENEEIIPLIQIERIESTAEPGDGLLF